MIDGLFGSLLGGACYDASQGQSNAAGQLALMNAINAQNVTDAQLSALDILCMQARSPGPEPGIRWTRTAGNRWRVEIVR